MDKISKKTNHISIPLEKVKVIQTRKIKKKDINIVKRGNRTNPITSFCYLIKINEEVVVLLVVVGSLALRLYLSVTE